MYSRRSSRRRRRPRRYDEDNEDEDTDMGGLKDDLSDPLDTDYQARDYEAEPSSSSAPNPLAALPPPLPATGTAYVPAPVTAPSPSDITSPTDNYPYYDDSPARPNENPQAAERRIDRASLAMGLQRKGVYQLLFRQDSESALLWGARKGRREKSRKHAEEIHANKINPNHRDYDAEYAQFWANDKASRKAFNDQRRAEALEHRRAYDTATGRPRAPTPDPADDSGDERYAPRQCYGIPTPFLEPYRQYPPAEFPSLGYMPKPGQFPVGIKTNPPSDRCAPCVVTKRGGCDLGKRGWYPCSRCVQRGIPDQCVNDRGRFVHEEAERPDDFVPPAPMGIPSNAGPPPTRRRAVRPGASSRGVGGPSGATSSRQSRVPVALPEIAPPRDNVSDSELSDPEVDSEEDYESESAAKRRRIARKTSSQVRPNQQQASSPAAPPRRPATIPRLTRGFNIPSAADLVIRQLGYQPSPGKFPLGIRTNPHSDKCQRCHIRKKGDCDLGTSGYPCGACVRDRVPDQCVNAVGYRYNLPNRTATDVSALLNQQNRTAVFNEVNRALPRPKPKPKPKTQPAPTKKERPKVKPAKQPLLPGQRSRSQSTVRPRIKRSWRRTCQNCRLTGLNCTGDSGACDPCRRLDLPCDDPANLYRHEYAEEDMRDAGNESEYDQASRARIQREPFGVSDLSYDPLLPGRMDQSASSDFPTTGPTPSPLAYQPNSLWQVARSPSRFNPARDWGTLNEEQQQAQLVQSSRLAAFREQQQDVQAASLNAYMPQVGQGPEVYTPAAYKSDQATQEFNTLASSPRWRNPRRFDPEGVLSSPEDIDFNQITGLLPPRSNTIQPDFVIDDGTVNLPDMALFSYDGSGETRGPLLDPLEGKAMFNRITLQLFGEYDECGETEDFCSGVYPNVYTEGPVCGKALAEPCYIPADHGDFHTCSDCTQKRHEFFGNPARELQRQLKAYVCGTCAPVISAKASCRQFQCDCIMTLLKQSICNRHMTDIFARYETIVPHIKSWFTTNFPQYAAMGQTPCAACANVAGDPSTDVWGCIVCRCWVQGS